MKNEIAIDRCRRRIERALGWGDASSWSNEDFDQLSEKIFDATAVRLSVSTLKRVWGKVRYDSSPTTATLNALARFAGFSGWRDLLREEGVAEVCISEEVTGSRTGRPKTEGRLWSGGATAPTEGVKPAVKIRGMAPIILLTCVLAAFVSLLSAGLIHSGAAGTGPGGVRFESRKVTDNLPNSVVFSYDASSLEPKEVIIQQSWDERRREIVAPNGKEHTSIYYYPGYFVAKLIVDGEIKRQSEVYIQTKGWKGIIERTPLPVYLKPGEIKGSSGEMAVRSATLRELTGSSLFNDTWVDFDNIREFPTIAGDHFTLETTLRNTSTVEECLCRKVKITILGRESVIVLPFSDKGCISDLRLFGGGQEVDGKDHDLSAFGCDFSTWQRVTCRMEDHRLTIQLNGHTIRTIEHAVPLGDCMGIRIAFEGAGEIKELTLRGKGQPFSLMPE